MIEKLKSHLLVLGNWVGVDCYFVDFYFIQWSVVGVNRLSLHQIQGLKSIYYLSLKEKYSAESCVLFVQFWHSVVCEEELTSVCVGPTVCHWKDASSIVLYCVYYLVLELWSVYTLAHLSCACGISALNYETLIELMNTFDVAVEDGVIVFSASCKSKEVFGGFGAKLAEELYFNISMSCMQGECHTFLTLLFKSKNQQIA